MNPIPSQVEPGSGIESLMVPLVYEPGTSWRYSHAIDWVGIFVERVSGIAKLGDYMKEHLFKPTGATSLTFEPEDAAYDNKMTVCERIKGEILHTRTGGVFGRARGQPSASSHFGGQGLYGTQRDYLRVLRGVLRSDPRWNATQGGVPLLSAESYRELFKPSVPLDDTAKGLDGPSRLAEMVGRPQYISPPATPESVNHSIACLVTLQDLDERRKTGSGCWAGVAKSQWWLDPVTGLAVSGCSDSNTSTLKALLRVFVPLNYLVRPRIIGLRSM
jgi:methyl acetate hydrolase